MKKQQKKTQILTITALAIFGIGMFFSFYGLSTAVTDIDKEIIAREPEAILASAGVTDGTSIDLPVVYYDQRSDDCANLYGSDANKVAASRQFEWSDCGYRYDEIEQGLVEYNLDESYLPVAVGGRLLSNRGLDMSRWFGTIDGKSKEYSGTLKLNYETNGAPEFSYNDDSFYPLDEIKFSAGDKANTNEHNRLFTMNFAVPFTVTASGGENFEITADDDTFVFVGSELAIDMGGIHSASTGRFMINEKGEVYTAIQNEEYAYSGIQVKKDEGVIIRIFHADRDSDGSVFKIRLGNMNLNVMPTQVAGADGVQVAYDPTNPDYVAPLGESKVFRPDGTKGHIIMATVFGVVVVVSAMFVVILSHSLIKRHTERK